ncbi:MAG: transporter substrate-binding domain-containing protein [Tissierellia bacterium]|nr:transporter substrate-binding domain-containing protein [Tissierellia bacterium]
MKKILALCLIMLMALGLVACGGENNAPAEEADGQAAEEEVAQEVAGENVLEKVKASGKLVVGTSADYPPYEFHAMIDGEDKIVGFDMDIAGEIAKDLGVELEIVDMDFDAILSAASTGVVDLGIAGINPDPTRDESVDFSDIYFQSEYTFLTTKENVENFKSLEDLTGLAIGVQMGSVQEELANEAVKDANVVALAKVTELVMQLQTGMIDGIILEVPVAQSYMSQNEGLALAEVDFADASPEGGSVVIANEGEKEILEEVNKTIKRLQEEGKIEAFYADAVALSEEEIQAE